MAYVLSKYDLIAYISKNFFIYMWGKSRFTVICETEFIFVLLFINYCFIFHMNNCKLPFAPPSMYNDIFSPFWSLGLQSHRVSAFNT